MMLRTLTRLISIGPKRYQVHFNPDGGIAHIDGQRHKRGGRVQWVWVWPRRVKGETPISSAVRDKLSELAGAKAGQ